MSITLTTEPFDANAELARFGAERGKAGALASFVGYCRSEDGAVTRLELEHYPGFTESEITALADCVTRKHKLTALRIVHRVGAIPAGDAIVLVAALSAHRAAAFAAVSEMMDYLKTDAPIWKREVGPTGARWVEPTQADRARREQLK
jgi:molybdopterin synthase catalytic subunit